MSESMSNGEPAADSSGQSGFLVPNTSRGGVVQDIRLLRRAIKEGWDIPPAMRPLAMSRLEAVLRKDTVEPAEAVADRNALQAVKALQDMQDSNHARGLDLVKYRQTERHHREGSKSTVDGRVVMIVADARGNQRSGTADDIRALAMGPPITPPETSGSSQIERPEPGSHGGPEGG